MANPTTLRKSKPKWSAQGSGEIEVGLRAQNKKLLRWLDSWLATPDDRGEKWWSEFEADLEAQTVTFQPTKAG